MSGDETARLLADAESFLRLGLVDKAIEHLASSLARDPSLRALREPLVRLYVSKRQYHCAIAELWALLSDSKTPQEEIRYLRYILRLGGKDPVAVQRLKAVLDKHNAALSQSREEAATRLSVSGAVEELRAYLGKHRPSTDLAKTMDVREEDLQKLKEQQLQSAAITRQNITEIEAVAEQMALESGSLKDQLRVVDTYMLRQQYDEAQRLLHSMVVSYPHSRRVRARLRQLFLAQAGKSSERAAAATPPEPPARHNDFHSAPTLPPWAGLQAPQLPVAPEPEESFQTQPDGKEYVGSHTIEVTAEDISEERELPIKSSKSPRQPPPPPISSPNLHRPGPLSEAESALRTGAMLRSFGQHDQAVVMFEKARDDVTCGAMAALLAGLSYRQLGRPQDAIASFLHGVNRPEASESDLNRMFYELGSTHEQLGNIGEAMLNYQLSLGTSGAFFDAEERIAALQARSRLIP